MKMLLAALLAGFLGGVIAAKLLPQPGPPGIPGPPGPQGAMGPMGQPWPAVGRDR